MNAECFADKINNRIAKRKRQQRRKVFPFQIDFDNPRGSQNGHCRKRCKESPSQQRKRPRSSGGVFCKNITQTKQNLARTSAQNTRQLTPLVVSDIRNFSIHKNRLALFYQLLCPMYKNNQPAPLC